MTGETYAGFARHPLTITTVGFLLTGVLGTLLSRYLSERQQQRDRFLQVTAARQSAVQEFARTAYDRWVRADMLWSALSRNAPMDEVRSRKSVYDEAYARWGRDLQANLFMIRTTMEAGGYTAFESDVEFRLTPILRGIDSCLTRAYDRRLRGADVGKTLSSCGMGSRFKAALNCTYAVTDQLFRIAVPLAPLTSLQREEAKRAAAAEIQAKCGT